VAIEKEPALAETPTSLDISVVYAIGRLDRVVRSGIDEVLRAHGVSVAQYTVLSIISHRSDLSNAQLARRSYVSPQSMMEVLKVLEELGLVQRKSDPNHGRIRMTKLTASGKRLLTKCNQQVAVVEAAMLDGFTDREQALFTQLVVRAVRNLGGGLSPD
jgi:DNA-binding MarR family transcriptional regulator